MGIDPEADDVMARPPRNANERAIDASMWYDVIVISLVMALATLLTIDLYLPGGLVEGSQSLIRRERRDSRCWFWPSYLML